ncbi:Zinc finger RING-type [Arabidopsis thaliana x Arabidopsis arenosa]|uniref:Zinc finger RING-type n=1 Tax=Arabidopsis thaliana x Arabidopsis arenosa TaxID=1240361 RepID=A0A8T1ZLX3_9BRAS|nr:Zinc finger RING-type [Arabidopsis thaliana x Arabidopsis arenosa]
MKVLEKWLALLYPRVQGGGGREEECCSVCLMRMEEEDVIKSLPCSHEFHSLCVDTWFNVSRKICCPLCRFSPATILLTDELLLWFSSFHF